MVRSNDGCWFTFVQNAPLFEQNMILLYSSLLTTIIINTKIFKTLMPNQKKKISVLTEFKLFQNNLNNNKQNNQSNSKIGHKSW